MGGQGEGDVKFVLIKNRKSMTERGRGRGGGRGAFFLSVFYIFIYLCVYLEGCTAQNACWKMPNSVCGYRHCD